MIKHFFHCLLISSAVLSVSSAAAELPQNCSEAINKKAKFNYQMFCQGCHTGAGEGHKSVPQLKGVIGLFLNSQQGREYLVRVPGSANSALNDADLAQVLNWMIQNFEQGSAPKYWQAYNANEIAKYRKSPLFEPIKYRESIFSTLKLKK